MTGPAEVRCWWCDVEPDDVTEIRTYAGTVRLIYRWPDGDHQHAERPPTADELLDAAIGRIRP